MCWAIKRTPSDGFNRTAGEQLPPGPLLGRSHQGPILKKNYDFIQIIYFSCIITLSPFSVNYLFIFSKKWAPQRLPPGPFFLNPPLCTPLRADMTSGDKCLGIVFSLSVTVIIYHCCWIFREVLRDNLFHGITCQATCTHESQGYR